jgi:hypothetical protein
MLRQLDTRQLALKIHKFDEDFTLALMARRRFDELPRLFFGHE